MSDFEKEVRKALIDKDMTLKDLCKALGISQCYLYDILNGARPGTKQKNKIIEILGLKQNWGIHMAKKIPKQTIEVEIRFTEGWKERVTKAAYNLYLRRKETKTVDCAVVEKQSAQAKELIKKELFLMSEADTTTFLIKRNISEREGGSIVKNGKKPTVAQNILIKSKGLNPNNWLVIKNLSDKLIVLHRIAQTTRDIPKEVKS